MFQINEVLRYRDELYRILAFANDHIVWISLDDDKAFPELINFDELKSEIDNCNIEYADDPYNDLKYMVTEDGSSATQKRDENYQKLQPLIKDPYFFVPSVRGAIVDKLVAEVKTTKQTVYRLARQYWQLGQTPNALLPKYRNSGGKGKRRTVKNKKLGRPRVYQPGTGAIIDEATERLFRIAIDKYILSDKGHDFPYAHRRLETLYRAYFPETSEEDLPSLVQLKYFYKREYSQTEALEKRVSEITFNKDIRPLHSSVNANVLGPGSRYEIDATIADVYLVSDSERRNIVGRPIVYLVVDTFSRMIAGLYIGFENPSYAAAMQALYMAANSKVEYCRKFDFDILDGEWPCIGLPNVLLADRGELLGHQIENLENNFAVRIENAPPHRGEAKGIVERYFRTIQASFGKFTPGFVTGTKIKKRGDKDYRLDAKLTITDFTKIILSSILQHNQYAVLDKYDRDVDMPIDLPNTPLALWNWGIQNRTGRLHQADNDALRIALLPQERVTLSERGVNLQGLNYTSPEILRMGWTHRGKEVKRPKELRAAYDPLSADTIYLFYERNSNKYWKCNLTDLSREFRGSSFYDVWQVKAKQKAVAAKAKINAKRSKREHEDFVAETIQNAVKSAPKNTGVSISERIRSIRGNRDKERQEERTNNAPKASLVRSKTANVIPLTKQQPDLDYPDLIDEFFEDD